MHPLLTSQPAVEQQSFLMTDVQLRRARPVRHRPSHRCLHTSSAASNRSARVLTPRELVVLKLVAQGVTNRAIARDLALSEYTVCRYVTNILRKLNVSNRGAAGTWATHHQLA